MANFMTGFKPTGGDWLSAIAKVLGSGSEFAGSMEKRKQEELFRKALMDYGVKSGELDTAEEQGLSERDLSTPTTTRMQSIKFGERIPSKEEMMRNQGGVDPASTKLQYPTSIEAPFETPQQSQNRLAGLAGEKYEGNTSDQLMKLMAMRRMEQNNTTAKRSSSSVDPSLKFMADIVKSRAGNPGKYEDEVGNDIFTTSLGGVTQAGWLPDKAYGTQQNVLKQEQESSETLDLKRFIGLNDPKGLNKYWENYKIALKKEKSGVPLNDKENEAMSYVISQKMQMK